MAYFAVVLLYVTGAAAQLNIGVFVERGKMPTANQRNNITTAINQYKSVISLPVVQMSYIELSTNGSLFQMLQSACNAIVRHRLHAALGPSHILNNLSQSQKLSVIFQNLQIPYSTTVTTGGSSNLYISDMFPLPRQEALIMFSLMRKWGWSNAAIVTNFNSQGKNALYQLYTLGGEYNFQFDTFLANDEQAYHDTVSSIDKSIFRLVILWCNCKCVERILSLADARGIMGSEWAWILSIEATSCVLIGFSIIAKSLNLKYQGLVGVLPDYNFIYRDFGSTTMSTNPYEEQQLVLLKPLLDAGSRVYLGNGQVFPVETTIPSCSGSYKSNIGSKLATAIQTIKKNGQSGVQWKYVNYQEKSWIPFAKWSLIDGYNSFSVSIWFPGKTASVSDLRTSLRGKHIWACTHTDSNVGGWKTIWMRHKPADLLSKKLVDDSELGGFQIDLFRTLAKVIGFNYSFTYPRDEQWGSRHPITGEWNGILRELRQKYCDIGAATLTITRARHTYFDFTHSYFDTGLTFIMRKPGVKNSPFRFMEPFTPKLWAMLLIALFVTGLIIAFINKVSPYEHHGEFIMTPHDMIRANEARQYRFQFRKILKEATTRFNFLNSQWFSISSLFQQGFDPPISFSGRVVTCVWWMAVLLFTATYTANMAAVLTAEVLSSGISSIKDLGDQEDILYGTMDKSGTMDFFQNTDVDLYTKMYARIMKFRDIVIMPIDEAIPAVRRGGYSFIWDKAVLDYEATLAPCELTTVGDAFNKINYAYALRPGSPYTRELNVHIMQLKAQGIVNSLYMKWFFRNSECPTSDGGTSNGLAKMGVKNLLGVFIIIYGCIAGSMVILVVEFYFACRRLIIDKDTDFKSYHRALIYRLHRIRRDWIMYYKPAKKAENQLQLKNQVLLVANVLQGQKIKSASGLLESKTKPDEQNRSRTMYQKHVDDIYDILQI